MLVSDTSVLVDLQRGNLLSEAFRLPFQFVVPDLLYERELQDPGRGKLLALGLTVADLAAEEVAAATAYRREKPTLSLPDAFALALAASRGLTLLTGDRRLRASADDAGVTCHGLLWLFDLMFAHGIVPAPPLCWAGDHSVASALPASGGRGRPKNGGLRHQTQWIGQVTATGTAPTNGTDMGIAAEQA